MAQAATKTVECLFQSPVFTGLSVRVACGMMHYRDFFQREGSIAKRVFNTSLPKDQFLLDGLACEQTEGRVLENGSKAFVFLSHTIL